MPKTRQLGVNLLLVLAPTMRFTSTLALVVLALPYLVVAQRLDVSRIRGNGTYLPPSSFFYALLHLDEDLQQGGNAEPHPETQLEMETPLDVGQEMHRNLEVDLSRRGVPGYERGRAHVKHAYKPHMHKPKHMRDTPPVKRQSSALNRGGQELPPEPLNLAEWGAGAGGGGQPRFV
ncbi:hypothetical protein C0995_004167 [Termitomyces sp. Mi166|nr:hypothetical protein C0995_004167 [Termitomyces sp. Mi166\